MNKIKYDLWMNEAINDYEMADILLTAKKYNGAVFYFIQSLEKSLKAVLYFFDLQPWGHSIINLINECEKMGISFRSDLKKDSKDFEKHYTWSRYPDVSLESPKKIYGDLEVHKIKATSKKFLDFIHDEIGRRL
jgi:HEPN domain-containing protein